MKGYGNTRQVNITIHKKRKIDLHIDKRMTIEMSFYILIKTLKPQEHCVKIRHS